MKSVVITVALLASACGCPSNSTNVDTKRAWLAERDAACAAVQGCDSSFVAQVPVYEEALEDMRELCDDSNARGCFCVGEHCTGVIMLADADVQIPGCPAEQENCWYTQSDIVLHEYVHAAMRSAGHTYTGDHPPEFELALQRARGLFRAP